MDTYEAFNLLLVAAFALSGLAGAVIRRWPAVLVPLVLVPLLYIGLWAGWWGSGAGDAWQLVGALVTLAAIGVTGAVVAATRIVARLRRS
jgi:hypothetical protein